MLLTIHRGSEEIGGTCVELRSGDSRIILDVGIPLVESDGSEFDIREYDGLSGEELHDSKVLPQVKGLYDWEEPVIDGVLISHAHLDHYGFLKYVHGQIPVYLSQGTQKIIEITALFTGKDNPLRNTLCFSWPSRFRVGAFIITPHLVDHSSFSAFAFEIEDGEKRVFYSGDFRDHGYLGRAMEVLYQKVQPGPDALLMEGTTLGREEGYAQTEEELSEQALEICAGTNEAVFIYQSGQNISRAVSFYKAAKRSRRLFIPDIYTAHVLTEVGHCRGGENIPRPGYPGFDDVKVWYPQRLTSLLFDTDREDIPLLYKPYKVTKDEMAEDLSKIMVFVRPGMENDLQNIRDIEGSTLIYSVWDGYRTKEKTSQFLEAVQHLGIRIETLHTSGHADLKALQRMSAQLKPTRIIPIHTFHPEQYQRLFIEPVQVIGQNEWIEI
jgi:ribonuclease J